MLKKTIPFESMFKWLLLCVSVFYINVISVMHVFAEDEVYGPPNLIKIMKTPFSANSVREDLSGNRLSQAIGLSNFTNNNTRRSLAERFTMAQLYLPSHMFLGKTAEFTVKGKSGSFVAIAMADKDSGAKPIYGHKIRLGSDRKVVAVGKVPASGLLVLNIETPIQGDLIGQCLYFEAVLWNKDDFSDLVIASAVSPEAHQIAENGVLIAPEEQKTRGLKFGPDANAGMMQRREAVGMPGLDDGKP